MATTKVQTKVPAAPVETKTPYDIAVDRVVAETHCTPDEAKSMMRWLGRLLDRARQAPGQIVFPRSKEMWGRDYRVFDAVMGHDAVAPVGSAHEALQNALLYPSVGELTIGHAQRNEFGEVAAPGERLYCTVTIGVGVFK